MREPELPEKFDEMEDLVAKTLELQDTLLSLLIRAEKSKQAYSKISSQVTTLKEYTANLVKAAESSPL